MVNPARAGMIPCPTRDAAAARCKPRASGDDPKSPFDIDMDLR